MYKVLVVDDDLDLRVTVSAALAEGGFQVEQAQDGEEAVNRVKAGAFDLVLLDVNMPRMTGIEALKEIKAFDPAIIVLILTAFSNVRDAVAAVKEGAYNYLEKPILAENLVAMIERALRAQSMIKNVSLSAPMIKLPNDGQFVGQSSEMKKVFSIIDKLSRVETAVLIRGESGTGKELVAQALHYNSPRKDNRFVTVNCSAITENLIESEFFGHEKGAFTGADSRKIGKFQYAENGTIFLDEIGDISSGMQVKLLRVLQEKRFTPVGSNREIEVNVRVVAATNRNLEEMIKKNEFREDLFYRLNVIPIHLPPLRDRKNDVEVLVRHFIEKFNVQHRKSISEVSAESMDILKNYSWPGNIRELENVIEHAFVLEATDTIQPESLPAAVLRSVGVTFAGKADSSFTSQSSIAVVSNNVLPTNGNGITKASVLGQSSIDADENGIDDLDDLTIDLDTKGIANIQVASSPEGSFKLEITKLDFQASKEEFEKQFLISALKTFKGKINQTALHANIPKKTLLRKLEKYGIIAKEFSNKPLN